MVAGLGQNQFFVRGLYAEEGRSSLCANPQRQGETLSIIAIQAFAHFRHGIKEAAAPKAQ